jgi:hypothetical protein
MVARQLSRTAFFGCSASLSLETQCFRPRKGAEKKWKASSSIGRAADSKSAGWGFDSLLACHLTCEVVTNTGGAARTGDVESEHE